ncbi:MAG: putative siderophore binding protein, partial [Nocardioidaceae bacterium]|nr:putative siderophore binding protein [Nocardioidaceae bacterium]
AALPGDATARVLVEVEGPEHEIDLTGPNGSEVTWDHRGTAEHAASVAASGVEPPLLAAVRALDWLPGRVQCFVHGEGEVVMKGIRPYLFTERGLPRDDVSISGYWRRGRTEEGFRAWKQELRAVDETAG